MLIIEKQRIQRIYILYKVSLNYKVMDDRYLDPIRQVPFPWLSRRYPDGFANIRISEHIIKRATTAELSNDSFFAKIISHTSYLSWSKLFWNLWILHFLLSLLFVTMFQITWCKCSRYSDCESNVIHWQSLMRLSTI